MIQMDKFVNLSGLIKFFLYGAISLHHTPRRMGLSCCQTLSQMLPREVNLSKKLA